MSIARRATSRIPPRTSTGWCPRAEEDRTIPTCKVVLRAAALGILVLPLEAALANSDDHALLSAYVQARAADSVGAADRASRGYAEMLALSPQNEVLAARALTQAIEAGDFELALRSARILERANLLSPDTRLLLLVDALRREDWAGSANHARKIEGDQVFAFMAPVVNAWLAFETKTGDPLSILLAAEPGSIAAAYSGENRPLIALAQGRDEGVAQLLETAGAAGGRSSRLRIAGAATLAEAGKRKAALALLEGTEPPIVAARRLVEKRKPLPGAIDSAATGVGEFFVRLAIDLHRQNMMALAMTFGRLATFLAPDNSEAWLVTSEILAARGQESEALEALTHVAKDDPFAATAADSRIRFLVDTGDTEGALARAQAAVRGGTPTAGDWTRLGDLYGELERYREAAHAYGQAIALFSPASGAQSEWALWLLRGGALEQAGDWTEAREALMAAYRLAPQQPIVLNYLGYAQLERRENIEEAMRLIAEASRLQPDSAEITDSLGWAYYLKGEVGRAIPLLEKAAEGEPADPAINEHLGDAYYSAGRHYEARYAWEAALVYAEEEDATRLRAKIDTGLKPGLASP